MELKGLLMTSILLVVEEDPVVAMDLSQTLTEWLPDGTIQVAPSLEEVPPPPKPDATPLVAVVSVSASELTDPAKSNDLGGLARHVVLLSDTTDPAPPLCHNCIVVPRPFTSEMIHKALASSGARRR